MSFARLGLLSMGLALWVFAMDISIFSLQVALATDQPTPGTALSTVRKQIVLRTLEGNPVPGITVQLAPALVDLGGPPAGIQVKSGVTDTQGTTTFEGLGQWIWMVSFSGVFQGKAIQQRAEQGRPPFGRTRDGGGFPVMVQGQEEDEAATPVVVSGTPQPETQPSLFVLVPMPEIWAPSLDLALPGEPLQPVSMIQTAQQEVTAIPTQWTASTGLATGVDDLDSFVRWFYILPVGVALFALYRGWLEHRQQRSQRSPRANVAGTEGPSDNE